MKQYTPPTPKEENKQAPKKETEAEPKKSHVKRYRLINGEYMQVER